MKREKANKKKTAVKPSSKKTNTKTKSTTVKKPSQSQFILKNTGKVDKQGNAVFTALRVYKRKPNGWKVTRGQSPKGFKMVSNGKSYYSGQRRVGLIKG